MNHSLDQLITRLIDLWMADIQVLTTPWVYLWVLPALLYLPFMILKWLMLTVPVWLPLAMALKKGTK